MKCTQCHNQPLAGLTPNQKMVYAVLAASEKPQTAYDILAKVQTTTNQAKAAIAPPTIYRALDGLVKNQLAHRLEALNAYILCHQHDSGHQGAFLICQTCQNATEITHNGLARAIKDCAKQHDFLAHHAVIEILGQCQSCQQQEP